MRRLIITLPAFAMLLCGGNVAADGVVDDQERLIPWNVLGGRPAPDELTLATADWTSVSRESLSPRVAQTLNRDWTFNYFPAEQLDIAMLAPEADDKQWPLVTIPHTWDTFETTREVHPFIACPSERDSKYWWHGWGVYRKTFELDPKMIAGRRVFIEFDGVSKYCRVWLNGKEVGDHDGSYASFYFDITSGLRPGTNVLAVAVNNRRDDILKTPPMTAGNFDVYGGITRDVRLVVKSPVYIPFQGSYKHEGGTFVTTPEVSATRSTVRVRTWVKNDDTEPKPVTLRTIIRDRQGKVVAQAETKAQIAVGEIHEYDQPGITVANPLLWAPDNPVMYRVESEVRVGNELEDRYASPLGFRIFTWNNMENRGYLNGKLLHIHGTNRHEEFPWLGSALPKWIDIRDMVDIRFGQAHNFMRTVHYTQDSLIYDLADRYGIMVCEEVPNIKELKFSEAIQRQQVIEMIRRDRNHPGIVMWSMGNETTDPANSDWAHAEDDTRIIHLRRGIHITPAKEGSYVTSTHANIDMENLLRCTVRGWTDSDVANFQPKNNQFSGTEEWQHAQAMVQGGSQRGRIDMPNGVMWIYADHGIDRQKYQNTPLLNINPKGWVDLYRIPKYIYWLWQANYVPQPMVWVHPQYWQPRYIGKPHDFIVDSNCETVELFVNGRSRGIQRPSAATFWHVTFTGVPVERGELKVVGRQGAKMVTHSVHMAGEPARLTLTSTHRAFEASRGSVAVLTMDVVDASGAPVPEFTRDLHWEVKGPATLLTPDTYETDIKKNMQHNGTFYIVAPVSTVVRSTGEPGEITVTVKAEGVLPASVQISATATAMTPGLVIEPPVVTAGRQPVATAPSNGENVKETSMTGLAMKSAPGDITLPPDKDRGFYRAEILKWFSQNDPAPMKRLAFNELADALADHLVSNHGLIVADDFDTRAQQFNDTCVVEDAIKARHLPESYAEDLVREYARRIIRDGELLQVADEVHWIGTLPADANVETLANAATPLQIFTQWYPAAQSLPAPQREAAFARFLRINHPAGNPTTGAKPNPQYRANSALLHPTLEQLLVK